MVSENKAVQWLGGGYADLPQDGIHIQTLDMYKAGPLQAGRP